MGQTLNDLFYVCVMRQRGFLRERALVVELGAQDMVPGMTSEVAGRVAETFRPGGARALANLEGETRARAYYEALGFDYRCFDCYSAPGVETVDLNFDAAPADLRGQADLVTNFGTTEHVFNQLNCFRFIHDATRVGGFMWHNVPSSDFYGHGFFKYDARLFERLGVANDYELKLCRFANSDGDPARPPHYVEAGLKADRNRHTGVSALLRKTIDRPFRLPLDLDTPGIAAPLTDRYAVRAAE